MKSEAIESEKNSFRIAFFSLFCWILLALSVLGLYGQSFSFGFTQDDFPQILQHRAARTPLDLRALLFDPIFPGNLYRPFYSLSFALQEQVSGLDAGVYHAGNTALYFLLCLALFHFLKSFQVPVTHALLASLLFAVSSIHVEAVASLAGRAELLSAFGVLSFFLLFRWNWVVFPLCFALLAFLSKESAFVLFPLLFLYWGIRPEETERRSSLFYFTLALLACFALVLRHLALGTLFPELELDPVDNPLLESGLLERVLAATALLGKYFLASLLPYANQLEYSFAELSGYYPHFSSQACLELILAVLLLVRGCLLYRAGDLRGFFLLWFFVGFFVTSNLLFPIGTIFAERLALLPSVGAICWLTLEIVKLKSKLKYILISFILALNGLASFQNAAAWKSQAALFHYQAKNAPASVRALTNYSVVLRNQGKFAEAHLYLDKALEFAPEYQQALFVKAVLFQVEGRSKEAKEFLYKTLEANPAHFEAANLLARILFMESRVLDAAKIFDALLRVNKNSIPALLGRFACALQLQEDKLALKIHRKLEVIAPQNPEFLQLKARMDELLSDALSETPPEGYKENASQEEDSGQDEKLPKQE